MKEKLKAARSAKIESDSAIPEEGDEINPRLKQHYDRLRKKYSEVRGRRVDWIDYSFAGGDLYVGVRFMDGTYFSLVFAPQIVPDLIEFSDTSTEDDEVLKTYFLRKQ